MLRRSRTFVRRYYCLTYFNGIDGGYQHRATKSSFRSNPARPHSGRKQLLLERSRRNQAATAAATQEAQGPHAGQGLLYPVYQVSTTYFSDQLTKLLAGIGN